MLFRLLRSALAGTLLLFVSLAHAQTPPSEDADMHAGIIKSVNGEVHVLSSDGGSGKRLAQPGDDVAAFDTIMTGADGGTSVVLRDGTVLVIGPRSHVELQDFHFDATTHDGGFLLSVLRGSLRMISGLIGKANPDKVRVETETTTIGIRGTDFIVFADAH